MKALRYDMTAARWMVTKAATFISKRALLGALSPLKLVDAPLPELPGPDWVRLRTRLGGICGTDLALFSLRQHPATILQNFAAFPATLGHENVADIDAVGSRVSDWAPGVRVCVEPALGCAGRGESGVCRQCAAGRTSLCEGRPNDRLPARALMGLNRVTSGSWAEYFVAHQSQLHRVPDQVTDDAAVLIDPIASAVHAVLRRAPRPGENVLVHGAGIIALGVIAGIRAMRLENPITVIARHPFQAELARQLGATAVLCFHRKMSSAERYDLIATQVGGQRIAARFGNQTLLGGFDLTFDCVGTGAALTDSIKWTRSRGSVVLVGTTDISVVDTTPIWFDEIEIVGANGRQLEEVEGRARHTYELVFEWLLDGRLDLSVIPITRFGLAQFRAAFGQLLRRGRHPIVKAVFDPRSS